MKNNSKRFEQDEPDSVRDTLKSIHAKLYRRVTSSEHTGSTLSESSQSNTFKNENAVRIAKIRSNIKRISSLAIIMTAMIWITTASPSVSFNRSILIIGTIFALPIALRGIKHIREKINWSSLKESLRKIGSFLIKPHTRFWIGTVAIGLCFMQVFPIYIEIFGQNVGYDPDAYRRRQLSASAPGLDKCGNPSWVFSDSISVNSGWYEVTRDGRDYWEKIFSGKGNAYLFAKIIAETANISIRINSTTLDFECSYGENYFSFSLSDNVDFYYIVIDKFYVTTMNAFAMIAVMPQVILEGGIDFTFSDDGDIDISDIQWIDFYGYGEITLLICPDFPMNSLYIAMDKKVDGSAEEEILTLHPWGNGLDTDKGNEFGGTPLLYGLDYAELVEQGNWPKYVIDIQSLELYDGENAGLHKLGIAADIKQGADDYIAKYGEGWKDLRQAHVSYLILVDQDWDSDFILDSDELNKYDMEPTFPDSWGYFSAEPIGDNHYPQDTLFTFYNNYDESMLYLTLFEQGNLSEFAPSRVYNIVLDGTPIKTTEYSGGPGNPYFICTNTLVSVGKHELSFTFEGEYTADSVLISLGDIIVYNMPALADANKEDMKTDSDYDNLPDSNDFSPDSALQWDSSKIQQLILPTTTDKDTVLSMQISRPYTDYYNLTHQSDQLYLWNNEAYVEINPIVKLLGNILSYIDDEGSTTLSNDYYTIRQPTSNPIFGIYDSDNYNLNWTTPTCYSYMIGLKNQDIEQGYGKDIETFSAVDYDYVSQNRIGDSLAVDWDSDGYPDVRNYYPVNWQSNIQESDNMEYDTSLSEDWENYDTDPSVWARTTNYIDTLNPVEFFGRWQQPNNENWDGSKGLWNYMGIQYGYNYAGDSYPGTFHTVGPYPSGFPSEYINEDLPTPQDFDLLYSDLTGNLSKRESQPIELEVTNKTFEFSYTFPAGHISKINDGNYDGVAGNDPTLDLKLMVQWEVNNLNYTQFNYRTYDEQGQNSEGNYNETLYYIDIVGDTVNVYKCYFLGTAQRGGDLVLSCPKDKFNLIMPSLSMYNSQYLDWEDHLGSNYWNTENNLPGTWYDDELELWGDTWGCKFGRTDFDTLNHMLLPLYAKFGQSGFSYHLAYYDWDEPILVQSIKSTEYDVIDYFVGSPKTPIESKICESIIQNPSIWNSKPVDNWGIDFEDIIYSYSGSGTIVKSMSYKDYAMNKFLDDVRNEEHIGVGWGMKTYDFKSLPLPTDWSFGGSTFYTDVTFNGETKKGVVGLSSASHNLIDPLITDKWNNGSISLELAVSNEGSQIRIYNQASGSIAVLLKTKLIDSELYWVIDTGIHDGQGNHIINNLGCKIRADRWQYLTIAFNCQSDSFGLLWMDDEDKLSPVEEQNNYAFYSDGGVNPNNLGRISYLYLTDIYVDQIDCGGLTQIDSEPMIVYTRSHEYTTWDICKLMHSNELKKNTNQVGGFFSYDNRNFYLEYQYSSGKWNPKLYYAPEEYSLLSNCLHQFFNDGETLSELGWTTSGTAIIGDDNLIVTDDGDNYYHHYQTLTLKGDSSASIGFPNPHDKALLTFEVGLSKKGDYNIVIQGEEQTPGDISRIELVSDGISDNWILKCHYEIPSLEQDITLTYDTGIGIKYGDLYDVKMMIDDFSGGTKLWINNILAGDFLTILLGDIYSFSVNNNNNDQSYQISVDNVHEEMYPDTLVDTTTNGDQAFEWDFVGLSHNDVYGSDLTYESTQFDYGVYRSGFYMDVDEIAFNGFIDIYGNAWEFDANPFIEYDSIYEENGVDIPDYAVATTIGHFTNNGQHKEQMTYAYGPKIGTEGSQPVYVKYIVDSSNYDGLYVKSNTGDKLVLNPMSQNVVDFYEWDDFNEWELWDEDFNKEFISSFVSQIRLPDYTSYTGLNIPVGTRLPVGTVITYKVDQTAFVQGFLDLLARAISSAPKEFKIEYSIGAKSNTCAFSMLDLSNKDIKGDQGYDSFDILYQDYDFFNIEDGDTCLTQGTFISKIPVSIDHITISQKNIINPTQTEYTSEILDISYAATDVHLDATKDVYNQIDSSNQYFKDYVQYIHDIYIDKDYNILQELYWDLDNDYMKTKFDSRWTDMISTHIGNIIWDKHPTGTSVSQLILYEFFKDMQWQKFSLLSDANGITSSIGTSKLNPKCYSISGKSFIERIGKNDYVNFYDTILKDKHSFFGDLSYPFKDDLFQLTETGMALRRLQVIESNSQGYKWGRISAVNEFLTADEMTSLRQFVQGYMNRFQETGKYQLYIYTELQKLHNRMIFGPDDYVVDNDYKNHKEEILRNYQKLHKYDYEYMITQKGTVKGWCPIYKNYETLEGSHLTRRLFGQQVGAIIDYFDAGNVVFLSRKFNEGSGNSLSKYHGLWLGLGFENNQISLKYLREHPELWQELTTPSGIPEKKRAITWDDIKQLVIKFNAEFSEADRDYFKIFKTEAEAEVNFYIGKKHYTTCAMGVTDVLNVLIYSHFNHRIDKNKKSPTYNQEFELNFKDYLQGCIADRASCDMQYDSLRRRNGLVNIKGERMALDIADITPQRIQQFLDIVTKSWGYYNEGKTKKGIYSAKDYFNQYDAFIVQASYYIATHPKKNCLSLLLGDADARIIAGRLMLYLDLSTKFKDKIISGDNLKAILKSPEGQNIITSWKNGYDTKIHTHCDKVIEIITARETSLEDWGLGYTKSFNEPKSLKSPDTPEQIRAKRQPKYSGDIAYSIVRYTVEDVSIFELYEDIAYYAKFFFLDGKERQKAIGDVVGLNALKQSLENNIFLSCFTEDVDLYIILKLREAGYTDIQIASQVILLRNQAKGNALKFSVADFWSIGERYDDIIEVMFYLSNLYVLGCYLSSGAITEAQYTQALFDLNLGLYLDLASIACLFVATLLRYSTKTGALIFNSLGFILQLLGTIINTIYLVDSWASMQLIDKILQTTLLVVQWVGVAAMFVNLAWGLTCSGLGTVLAVVAWICVAITIVWHWRDPVYFNMLNFNINSSDVETRNHGAIVEGIEGSVNFIYVKGDDWFTEAHRGYVTHNLPYEDNNPYEFSVAESLTEKLITVPYAFDTVGCDMPLQTIFDFDVYKAGWQHNFGIDFYTKLTVVESSIIDFYANIDAITNLSNSHTDADHDGLSLYLEDFYGTDPLNRDTDEDGIYDGIEVGELCPYSYKDTFSDFNKDTHKIYYVSDLSKTNYVREIISISGKYGWDENHIYKPDVDYTVAKTNGLVTSITWACGTHAYPLDGTFTISYKYGRIENNPWGVESDPLDPDTDDDMLVDGMELLLGTDINNPDSDKDWFLDLDGLTDGEEVLIYHTDPLNRDTDEDGLSDYVEVKFGYDPLSRTLIDSPNSDTFSEYTIGMDPWKSTNPLGIATITDTYSTDDRCYLLDYSIRQLFVSKSMDSDWSIKFKVLLDDCVTESSGRYAILLNFADISLGFAFNPEDSTSHTDPAWQIYVTSGSWTDVSTSNLPPELQWRIWEIQWDESLKAFKFLMNANLIYTLPCVQFGALQSITLNNRYDTDIGNFYIDTIDYSWDITRSFTQFSIGADPLYDSGFSTGTASIDSTGYQITSGTRRLMITNDMTQDWSFDFNAKMNSASGDNIVELYSNVNNYVKFAYDHTEDTYKYKLSSDSSWNRIEIDNYYEIPIENVFANWKVYWDSTEEKLMFSFNDNLIANTSVLEGFTLNSIIFDTTSMTISNYNYDIEGDLPQYINPIDYKGSETFFNFADSSDPWFGEGTAQIINMYQGHHKVYELVDANRHQSEDLAMNQNVVTEAWVNLGQHNSTGSTNYYIISGETHVYSSQYTTHPKYRLVKEAINTPYSSIEITGTYNGSPLHSFHYNEDFIIVNTDSPPNTAMDSIEWITGENAEHPDEGTVFAVTYNVAELFDYRGHYSMTLQLNNGEKFSLGYCADTAKYQYKWNSGSWTDIDGWNAVQKDMQWVVWRVSWLDGVHKFKVDVIGQDGDYSMSKEFDTFGDKSLAHIVSINYDCSENTGGFMHIDSPSFVGDEYALGDLQETIDTPQISAIECNYDENSIDFVWENADQYNLGVYYSSVAFDVGDISDINDLPDYITYAGPFTSGFGSIYPSKAGDYTLIFQSLSGSYSAMFTEPYTINFAIEDKVCDFSSDSLGDYASGWSGTGVFVDNTHTVLCTPIEFESGVLEYYIHERLIDNSALFIEGICSGIHTHYQLPYRHFTLHDSNTDGDYDSIIWDSQGHPDIGTIFTMDYQYLNYEEECIATIQEVSVMRNWYSNNPTVIIPKMLVLNDTSTSQYTHTSTTISEEFNGDMFLEMQLLTNDTSRYSAMSFKDDNGNSVLIFLINGGTLSLNSNGRLYEDIAIVSDLELLTVRYEFNINNQLGQVYINSKFVGEYPIKNCTNIQSVDISTSIVQSDYYIALNYLAYGQQSDSEADSISDKEYTFEATSNISSVTKDLSSTTIEKGGCVQGNYYYSADMFAIYDISNSSTPVQLYLSEESYQDVEIVDNFAYALGTSSISVYDISNKSNPAVVNTMDIWAPYTILETQLNVFEHVLYLLLEHDNLYVRTYDISDPLNIITLDTLDIGLERDSGTPQTKVDSLTQNYIVSFIEDIDNEGKVVLVDVSNPTDMSVAYTIDTNIASGFGSITTSFGYVYCSYVDSGANKMRIYDIINHFDPRLVATKDISGSYPIYAMDIYENSLYVNRQTATSTYTFEVYSIMSKANPTYSCAVSVDCVGEIIISSHIILISGTSKTCVIQAHYSVNGINTMLFDGLVTGSVNGLSFPAFTQGIVGFDFVGPATSVTNWLHIGDGSSEIGLIKHWSINSYSKMFYETPDYNTFNLYDSNYDIWGDQGYSGNTKVIDLINPLGSKAYQFSNAQRSASVSLSCDYNFYVESNLCVEKISGTTGMYAITLVDSYGTIQIAFAYNIADQTWYYRSPLTLFYWTEAELIHQVIPTAMTYQTWKIVSDSCNTFSLYLDETEICEAMAFYDGGTTIVSIAYDDTSSGAKMWLAGYRTFVNSYYSPFAEITPSQINTFKLWFNCPDHEVAVFLNGELLDIYKMNVNLNYINSLWFTYSSLLMRNIYSVSLDEDLDEDGLTSTYEALNSLSDVDADTDNDGMPDGWEVANGLNPSVPDSSGDLDGDLAYNIDEYTTGTSANCADSDHDSMPDKWEITYGLNPNSPHDAQLDSDSDGIINVIEFCSSRIYTTALNPTSTDSDSDTMPDDYEMFWRFDPSSALDKEQDADGDYLQNYREREEGTNPRVKDTDNDGMWDKWELDNDFDPLWNLDAEMDADWDDFNTILDPDFEFHNVDEFLFTLDPHDWDTDDDGLPDGYEVFMATHEEYEDADLDYMDDTWEILYGFRPYSAADNTPYKDGPNDDFDNDWLTNYEECNIYHTNPINPDTDEDGLTDGWEVCYGYDPLNKHSDTDGLEDGYEVLTLGTSGIYTDSEEDGAGDGLFDNEEVVLGTNPMSKDTDNDGLEDGYEVHTYNTDPLDIDTDNDGLLDGSEVSGHLWWDPFKQGGAGYIEVFTDPADNDTDDDGLLDGEELGRTEYDWNGGDVYYDDTTLYFATLGSPDNYPTSHGSLVVRRTNPDDWDSDGDGASDGDNAGVFEWDDSNPNDKHWKTDPLATDTDGDQLTDYTEMHGWDIYYDSDSDGYPDTWLYGVTSNPRKTDSDGDNIGDLYEYSNGYHPSNSDWDGDGLTDNEELLIGGPYYHNPEGHNIPNGFQQYYISNPWDSDSDSDGLTDHEEWHGPYPVYYKDWYSNPMDSTTDADSISDFEEYYVGNDGYITNPSSDNTDADTMKDDEEISLGLNPTTYTPRPYWTIYDPNDSTPAHVVDIGIWSVTPTGTDYGTAMQYADTSYYTRHTWGSVFGGSGNHYWYLHGYDSIPSAAKNSNFQGEVRVYLTYYVHYVLKFDYIKMNLVFEDATSLGYFQVIGDPAQGWHTTSFAYSGWATKVQQGHYVEKVEINVNSWIGAGQYVSWDQISIKYNY